MTQKKVYLIILDGYGLGKHERGDAIYHAKTPYFDELFAKNPHVLLKTDGECVGLPAFQTGGSEVGHITIGSGRAVKHLLTKINDQIDSGEFFKNQKLQNLFEMAQKKSEKNSRIHFCGMLSDGGIHSFQPHLYGLLQMAKNFGIQNIFLHLFVDGRDVAERSIKNYLQELYKKISEIFPEEKNRVKIATLSGRYFAMDRDTNWDRIEKISDLMLGDTKIVPEKFSIQEYIENFYTSSADSDYYLPPALFDEEGKIQADDVVINFNYRSDRSRQISQKIIEKIPAEHYGIFGPYCEGSPEIFSFGSSRIKNTFGEVLAKNNKTQLRISETEKFNHVTFFFSGEQKEEFSGETRILVPSPKCKSYAEKPEMSAREQTAELKKFLENSKNPLPDCIVQNYANADLVGHFGDFEAVKISIEVLDECLAESIPFAEKKGYMVFITADHGNADEMILPNGEPNASHTKNFVPFILVNPKNSLKILREKGTLQDIAPTILKAMDLEIPSEMTGENLFEEDFSESFIKDTLISL